ncbi:WGxxGxxG family protein [Qipengyuania sediminis]|uniref:WGxxGxxG family protein n=1 Tax=Qipengyuania sediminis TaxID=1532023 RepID=UPI00105A2F9F|nr:WGxxGxxG family protein [Qipengyuania sediminis]
MRKLMIAAAAASLLATPVLAQTTTTTTADPAMDPAMTAVPVEEDDNDFPWGLLGLLGLAGLLGRNKRDTHVHHDTTTTRRDI